MVDETTKPYFELLNINEKKKSKKRNTNTKNKVTINPLDGGKKYTTPMINSRNIINSSRVGKKFFLLKIICLLCSFSIDSIIIYKLWNIYY